MADVIDLAAARVERGSHLSGPARCQSCGHGHVAVAPSGTLALECPECRRMTSFWEGEIVPADGMLWRCDCGCMVFMLGTAGAICVKCGTAASWEPI